jgi:hypothetical protein
MITENELIGKPGGGCLVDTEFFGFWMSKVVFG